MTTARRISRLTALLIVAAVLVGTAAITATAPPTADASALQTVGDPVAKASGCRHLKRKARRARRGSAKRRRYVRAYQRCLRNAARAESDWVETEEETPAPAPAPEPAPAPAPEPAPAPAPTELPNYEGFVPGAGCMPAQEARYNASGFTCQFSGQYQSVYLYPAGWVQNKIYILFRLCADGSGQIC